MFPCLLLVSLLKNYKAGHFWIKIYGISQQKRLIHAWINRETVLFINRRLSEVKSIKVISTRGEHFAFAVKVQLGKRCCHDSREHYIQQFKRATSLRPSPPLPSTPLVKLEKPIGGQNRRGVTTEDQGTVGRVRAETSCREETTLSAL